MKLFRVQLVNEKAIHKVLLKLVILSWGEVEALDEVLFGEEHDP